MGRKPLFVVLIAWLLAGSVVAAQESADSLPPSATEQASWRQALEDKGVTFEAIMTTDVGGNVRGGAKQSGVFLQDYDLVTSVDTGAAGLWEGGNLTVFFIGDVGRRFSSYVGDLQGTDNLDARTGFRLFQLTYEQKFLDDKASVLAGLYDYNSEFNLTSYGATLINGSFGITPDVSQIGISTYPTTSWGTRFKAELDPVLYAMGALVNSLPPDAGERRAPYSQFDQGLFSSVEIGTVRPEDETDSPYYKLAGGWWYDNKEFEDVEAQTAHSNQGWYLVAERQLFTAGPEGQGLGVFFQYGGAQPGRNVIGNYLGGGISYVGLFPCRTDDVASFGIAQARTDHDYRQSAEDATHTETTFEWTYRAKLKPWLEVQPDVQWVHNPGATTSQDDALVLMVRTAVSL